MKSGMMLSVATD